MAKVNRLFYFLIVLGIIFLYIVPIVSFAQQGQKVDIVPLDFGIKQTIVSVGTSATPIPTTALSGRKSIMIKNLDSATVYIGSSTVTANTASTGGFPLAQNEVFIGDIGENTIIYGIVASGNNNVACIEAR